MAKVYVSTEAVTCARDPKGSFVYIYRGQGVPVGALDETDAKRLVKRGFLEVRDIEDASAAGGESNPASPATIGDVLTEVGDDKVKAQEALDAEKASAKPRTTLVDKLQAVIDAA